MLILPDPVIIANSPRLPMEEASDSIHELRPKPLKSPPPVHRADDRAAHDPNAGSPARSPPRHAHAPSPQHSPQHSPKMSQKTAAQRPPPVQAPPSSQPSPLPSPQSRSAQSSPQRSARQQLSRRASPQRLRSKKGAAKDKAELDARSHSRSDESVLSTSSTTRAVSPSPSSEPHDSAQPSEPSPQQVHLSSRPVRSRPLSPRSLYESPKARSPQESPGGTRALLSQRSHSLASVLAAQHEDEGAPALSSRAKPRLERTSSTTVHGLTIIKLCELKQEGFLTDGEFAKLKASLIAELLC